MNLSRTGSSATVYFELLNLRRHRIATEPPRHRSALARCQMAANQSVLVPDQSHDDNVEHGQHYEADTVRVREAVELVDDEEAKDDQRNRISPRLVLKQTDDEEHLDDAVAEETEGIEALGADGKILRQAQEVSCNKVIWIFGQFLL